MKHYWKPLTDALHRTSGGLDIPKRYTALVIENAKLRRHIWHLRKLLAYYQEDFR